MFISRTNLNDFCHFECTKCRTTKYFWSSKKIEQWPKILNFKLQTSFISLNYTMIPFTSKAHILFISKKFLIFFCHFEWAKCRTTKSFWSSKKIEQWPKILNFILQTSFISLNYTSKAHILLISKPIWTIFVILNVLSVKLQSLLEVQGQHNNDQKSCILNCKLV